MKRFKYNPLFVTILLISPFVIYWLTMLLPTFDDWGYFTTPDYDFGDGLYNRIIPRFSYWRPWDCLFGYVLHCNPSLFPALNHIAVYIGHIGGTYIIYRIARELRFNYFACNLTALYFFISPAMLGTVLGIDSINQAFSSFWGLLATYIYLKERNAINIAGWLLCTIIGTLAKENAIVFFCIPQIMAFAFGKITLRQCIKDYIPAAAVIILYFGARTLLTTDVVYINDEYFENTIYRKLKNICVFLGMTWLPLDFVSLVHPPSRNLWITAITILLSFPFMAAVFYNKKKHWLNIQFIALAVCLFMSVSVHLVTLFTAMHPYAGLGFASLIIGYMADKSEHVHILKKLLPLFIISCFFIDWHHWQKSYESGLIGKNMAEKVINDTGKPVDNVYLIIVDDDYPKFSSFCVIPNEAFGLGKAACSYTGYTWPKTIDVEYIESYDKHKTDSIADKAISDKYDKVWLICKDKINVIR